MRDVIVTWVCLGGGVALMILSVAIISRVQARTRSVEASRTDTEDDD